MKKIERSRRLQLKLEALRILTSHNLERAKGGGDASNECKFGGRAGFEHESPDCDVNTP